MGLAAGTRIGPYEVVAKLGAGGMGEVYRAKDTKLNREVALKVLPDSFATDPDRLARFTREAQTLAALNHPHIAQIHGLEESGDVRALVIELVEGEDLADRIERARIPLDEALSIGRQIAEALEAAHEQGIIHRDLKPANIKLRPDGTVKVLDFGLAKAIEQAGGDIRGVGPQSGLSHSPTITSPAQMTAVGMLLGTAAYMAPEQAKGRPADKRSDIWAFGCVFYEMLTGVRVFRADEVSEVLALVLTSEPDWSRLPEGTPLLVRRLLKRCLQRDPVRRLGDFGAARLDLADAADEVGAPPHEPQPWVARRSVVPWLIALLAVVGAAAALVFRPGLTVSSEASNTSETWLSLTAPADKPFFLGGNHRSVALTPDGTRLVYVTRAGLAVRDLRSLTTTILPGTEEARAPFISPDGARVGFAGIENQAFWTPIEGGPVRFFAHINGGFRGGAFTSDSHVIHSHGASRGLVRVPLDGGTSERLTTPDEARGESNHAWPSMLPNGKGVLFTVNSGSGVTQTSQVAVLNLEEKTYRTLLRGAQPSYLGDGRLLFVSANRLVAASFNQDTMQLTGEPVPVLDGVTMAQNGAAEYTVSDTGTLIYVPGTGVATARSLVWKDRTGRETVIPAPPANYTYPRLSPDDTRLALDIRESSAGSISIYDFGRSALNRLTAGSAGQYPLWHPDGMRLIFSKPLPTGGFRIFIHSADGTGLPVEVNDESSPDVQPYSISPDGAHIVARVGRETFASLGLVASKPGSHVEPLVQSPRSININAEISPDGRFMALQSNDSGRFEIYVVPFPGVNAARWQISSSGGTRPLWSRDGRELFFLDFSGAVMRVPVVAGTVFAVGTPDKLFDAVSVLAGFPPGRNYDVAADRRFVMIKDRYLDSTVRPIELTVVLNWVEGLTAKTR